MSTLDWSLQQATKTTAQIAAATTIIPLTGQIVWNTDTGKYCIGDGTTALSALTFYGGISASGLTVGTTTITGGTNTKVLYNNNGVVGEYTVTGTGSAVLNTSPTFVTGITTPYIYGSSSGGGSLNIDSTSNVTKGLIEFGSSTRDNMYKFNIGTSSGNIQMRSRVGSTTQTAIYLSGATPDTNNYNFLAAGSALYINTTAGGTLILSNGSTTQASFTNTTLTFTGPPVSAAGNFLCYNFAIGTKSNVTASANATSFKITGNTKQWATGTVANQYWNYLSANTAAFVGASTMTNSYGLYVEAATAGTNATITNNYSLGTNGKAKFGGNIELTQTVTTEALVSDTSVTIVINGVTYKLLAKA